MDRLPDMLTHPVHGILWKRSALRPAVFAVKFLSNEQHVIAVNLTLLVVPRTADPAIQHMLVTFGIVGRPVEALVNEVELAILGRIESPVLVGIVFPVQDDFQPRPRLVDVIVVSVVHSVRSGDGHQAVGCTDKVGKCFTVAIGEERRFIEEEHRETTTAGDLLRRRKRLDECSHLAILPSRF